MNDAKGERNSSITNFAGAKSPPGIFNLKRALMVSFLLFSFLLAIGIASATITVQGDIASGDDWDIYVFEGTNGLTNPCSGTNNSDFNTSPAGGNSGDTAYDDDDDYTLSWEPGGAVDVNVWFCEDGVKYANWTQAAVADGTTLNVDLGRVSGDTHDNLDQNYIHVCTDFNGTKLNTEGPTTQVDAGNNNFIQYYAFEDGTAANQELWVFFDYDTTDTCIWDATKTTGRQISTISADAGGQKPSQ